MSAFLLPDTHINALVSFAKGRLNGRNLRAANGVSYDLSKQFDYVGRALRAANEESLVYRYAHRIAGELQDNPYVPKVVNVKALTLADIINAADCYHYQSCEHPLYQTNEAYFIVEAIKSLAVDALIENQEKVWVIGDDLVS